MSPKIHNIGLGSHGHVHQVQEPTKSLLFGLSNNEIEKLLVQMKQNNSTELAGYSFDNISNKNGLPDTLERKITFFLEINLF